MKKIYFLLSCFIGITAFGQDLIITGVFDGPLTGGTPKVVELYVVNDIADLSAYGISSANNGGGATGAPEFNFSGSATGGEFLYITPNETEFTTYFGFPADFINSVANINGDDAIELFFNGNVIDVFGQVDLDGTGQPWDYVDGWAYRVDSTGPDGSTFILGNWTFSGTNATDGCTTNASCASVVPIGTFSNSGTPCGVSFGTAVYTCASNTLGDNNDGVTLELPYTGSNNTIVSVSVTGGTLGGDDPALTPDGTITISGLIEGDTWSITLNGGDCDGTTTSGTVPVAECDPVPSTCFDLSTGPELFELVTVVSNSENDTWTASGGTYSMNGFCGGGCIEESNTWLIFGPLDMTGVSDLQLLIDASENFDGTELNIQYTSDYSSNCPDGAVWTSALTINSTGSYSADLSAASGTAIFVGVQYLDNDGTFSSWSLSNVSLASFNSCPTLGSRPVSDCAICDVTLQTETYTCITNTSGDNNDSVIVNIPYTGLDNSIVNVSVTGGTLGGDDPALTADGTITISGLTEGDAWSVTLNGGDCDGATLSGTVQAAQCDPVTQDLVINEILADPDSTSGDANGDGTVNTSQDEFVELYNAGSDALDLSNYTISDAVQVRHTFPEGTILPANSFITVFGGGTPVNINGIVQVAGTGTLGLNNGGDTVILKNVSDVVVVEYSYGSEGGNNQSLAREPDFTGMFVQHLSHSTNPVAFSPGERNDGQSLSNLDFATANFSLYPNPVTNGSVTISSNSADAMQVQVYDVLGKVVKNEILSNNTLNVSNLNTGLYIIKITQNQNSVTKKLVIK